MPRDQVSESELFVAPAITPSRELVPDLPAPVDPVLRHLIDGRAALINPSDWCQGATVNESGQRCSWGALRLVNGDRWECEAEEYLKRAALDLDPSAGGFIGFNDGHSHSEVIAMWDRAIASRKAES